MMKVIKELVYSIKELKQNKPTGYEKAYADYLEWRNEEYCEREAVTNSLKAFLDIFEAEWESWDAGCYPYEVKYRLSKWVLEDENEDYTDYELDEIAGNLLEQYLVKSPILSEETLKKDAPLTGYYLDDILLSCFKEYRQGLHRDNSLANLIELSYQRAMEAVASDIKSLESEACFLEYSEGNNWYYFEDGRLHFETN